MGINKSKCAQREWGNRNSKYVGTLLTLTGVGSNPAWQSEEKYNTKDDGLHHRHPPVFNINYYRAVQSASTRDYGQQSTRQTRRTECEQLIHYSIAQT